MGAAKTKEVKGAVSIHNNRQSKRLVLDRRRSCLIERQLDKRIIIFTHRSLCNSISQAISCWKKRSLLYLRNAHLLNHAPDLSDALGQPHPRQGEGLRSSVVDARR